MSPCCGIAKRAILIDVRILNENNVGNVATTIQGLQYVTVAQQTPPPTGQVWPNQPAIINLSVEGANRSVAFDAAIDNIYRNYQSITVVAASGNKKRNACETSPAGARFSITAAATDRNDRFWYPSSGNRGSNYGRCVDVLAPGVAVSIPSQVPNRITMGTGTSISAAFVSGTLARLISSGTSGRPSLLRHALITSGSYAASTVTNLQTRTTNRLLHMECV